MDPNADHDASDEIEYGIELVCLDPAGRTPAPGVSACLAQPTSCASCASVAVTRRAWSGTVRIRYVYEIRCC